MLCTSKSWSNQNSLIAWSANRENLSSLHRPQLVHHSYAELWEAQFRCWRWLRHDCTAKGRMRYFSNRLASLSTGHETDFFYSGISEIVTESGYWSMWGSVSLLISIELYWCTNKSVRTNLHAALYKEKLWDTKLRVSWKDLSTAVNLFLCNILQC